MKECVGGRIYRRANEYYLPCFILKKEVYECLYDLDAGHSKIRADFPFVGGQLPLQIPLHRTFRNQNLFESFSVSAQ